MLKADTSIPKQFDTINLSGSIGVFDSGSGGLTILQALQTTLPMHDFLYFGDHQRAPYGEKTGPEVYEMTRQAVRFLFDQGCNLVILACNTASAIALRKLQQEWLPSYAPNKRILGVLVPMVETITDRPWIKWEQHPQQYLQGTVGIFATEATVKSKTYLVEIGKRAPQLNVIQQACPELVPALETKIDSAITDALVEDYVSQLVEENNKIPNWIMLGCTHYPLLKKAFEKAADKIIGNIMGQGVPILCQPSICADSLADYLKRHPKLTNKTTKQQGKTQYFTSGDPEYVKKTTAIFRSQTSAATNHEAQWIKAL
ncbi:glutamate racemase [Kiloniella sp. EL199]|uniref:glutamate racemase n=1 Tax=Kiloniella sp. EL199 TaxID=2107581 RepID=UPI000EA179A9|nr:glutamate racemase [Kiloniella sp. EL199]